MPEAAAAEGAPRARARTRRASHRPGWSLLEELARNADRGRRFDEGPRASQRGSWPGNI